MKFIRADRIREGDVVVLAGDEVDEVFAKILSAVERKDGQIHFTFSWRYGKDSGVEEKMCRPHARCLLVRRPKRKRKK